ncbi:hypothetical protein BKA56DRAFT_269946 [Ilyonectria sp. MPI-CAGE-AT-0026]|nr:hypothetical protein BKA56DRAFT_269946 [Ilyonectria sp. MPI-CAGE-AT-0026]
MGGMKNPKARRHEAFGCHIIRLGPTRSPYCRPWLANTAWPMLSEYNGSSLQLTDYWLRRPNLYRSVEQPPLRPDQELSQRHFLWVPILLRTVGRLDNTVDSSLLRTPISIAPAVQRPGLSGAVAPLMPTSVRAGLRQQNGTAVVSVETGLSAHVPRRLLEGCRGGRGPLSTVSVSVSVPSWHPRHAKATRPEWNPGALEWPDGTLRVTSPGMLFLGGLRYPWSDSGALQRQAHQIERLKTSLNLLEQQPVETAHQRSTARPKFYRAAIPFGLFTRGWARLRPIQAALGPLAATIRVQSSSMDYGLDASDVGAQQRQLIEGLNFQPSARPTLRELPNRGGSSDSIRVLHRQYRRYVVTGLR